MINHTTFIITGLKEHTKKTLNILRTTQRKPFIFQDFYIRSTDAVKTLLGVQYEV